jgi:ubiquinone/menaquinone biosynthesis C-methylase UbiE
MRKHVHANEKFHDRISKRYDEIYAGPRWAVWDEISWSGVKPYLPQDLRAPVLDLGCGTGKFGLRIAKSGFTVTLSDLSHGMLEAARRKAHELNIQSRCTFVKADLMDLSELPRDHFQLAIAQGDPLSFADHPPKALKEIRKTLRTGGVFVASLDATHAAIDHYIDKDDLEGLEHFLRSGDMEWLANDESERFPVHTFTPEDLRQMFEQGGFEVLDLFGKTVLPFKRLEHHFEDERMTQKILALEKKLCRNPSAMGRASHLQIAARKIDRA